METAVQGALAQALDGKVAGDLKGGGNHCYVGGPDPRTGETFIFYEYPAGGTGGFDGGDGSNTVRAWTESDMTTLQPIEAIEQLYPVRVEATALREDSGGPGQWRGGLGLTRAVRILAPHTRLSVLAERAVLPPFGVCGAGPGATNRFWIRRDGQRGPALAAAGEGERVSGAGGRRPHDGELGRRRFRRCARARPGDGRGRSRRGLRHAGRGGGDLRSRAGARRGRRDGDRRAPARPAACGADTGFGCVRCLMSNERRAAPIRIDEATARALGLVTGGVIELVNPRGAPLRAWVVGLLPGNGRRGEIAAAALRMLALTDGAEVEIRAVHSGILST